MAANDRETTFTIKAADLSTQPINQVIAAVERLIAIQKQQNAASDAGTVNANEFKKSLADVGVVAKAAGDQITALQRSTAILDEMAERTAKLADLEDRRDKLSRKPPEERTRFEVTELARLEKQILSAQKAVEAQDKVWKASMTQMEAMGASMKTLSADMERLRAISRQLSEVMTEAGTASLSQVANRQKAQTAANELAAAEKRLADQIRATALAEAEADAKFVAGQRAAQQAEKTRLAETEKSMQAANQIKSPRAGREEDIRAAFKSADEETAARKAADDAQTAALEARRKQRELDLTAQQRQYEFEQKLLRESLRIADERLAKEKALAEQRERVNAQQNMAAEAMSRRAAASPLGQSPEAVQDFSGVSRSLSSIIDPATTARQTIDGLTAEIDRLANAFDVKGRRRPEDLARDLRDISVAAQELKRQGSLIDMFQAQEAATLKAQAAMKAQEAEMSRLQRSGQSLNVESKDYVNAVRATEVELRRLSAVYEQANAALTQQRAALERAGIDYHNLDEEISRLRASATATGEVFGRLNKDATGGGGSGGVALFGLRPYELQNLSYQINDVFTQLASGTPITQVFAQQGGQFFQLFQKQVFDWGLTVKTNLADFASRIGGFPVLLAAAAAATGILVVAVMALSRAYDIAAQKRVITAQLTLDVDGTKNSTAAMLDAAKAAERMGVSFSDAAKGTQELQKSGFSDAQIKQLSVLAADLSKAKGIPFADAIKGLNEAFTGGYEAVRRFSQEFTNLTDAEDKRIHELLDANKLDEARAVLFEAIAPRIAKASKEATTDFSQAILDLKNNWHDLMEAFGADAALTRLTAFFATTVKEVRTLVELLNLAGQSSGNQALTDRINAINGTKGGDQGEASPTGVGPGSTVAAREGDLTRRLMDDLKLSREQAAGLVGQIGHESGVKAVNETSPVIPGSRGGFGYAQWTGERRDSFEKFAKDSGLDPKSDAANYGFLLQELRTTHADVITALRKETTVAGSTRAALPYETGAPAGKEDPRNIINMPSRLAHAQAAFDAAGAPSLEGAAAGGNRQAIATRAFNKEQDDKERAARQAANATETQLYADMVEKARQSDEEISKSAQAAAKAAGALSVDQTELERHQAAARLEIWQKYEIDKAARAKEVTSADAANRDKELNADKTNLAARLAAIKDEYDAKDKLIEQNQRRGLYPADGLTVEDARANAVKGREDATGRATIETAQAQLAKVTSERDDALKIISTQLEQNKDVTQIPGLLAKRADIETTGSATVREAVQRLQQAIDQYGKGTVENRALRQRSDLILQEANNPRAAQAITQESMGLATKSVADAQAQRSAEINTVISQMRAGGIQFDEAVHTAIGLSARSLPQLNTAVAEARRALEVTRDAPGTSVGDKAKINEQIAANTLAQTKAAEDIQRLIMEGLKDANEKLAADRKAQKDEEDAVVKGITDYAEMIRRRAEVAAKYAPIIRADADRVVANTRTALEVPGLTPGFRAQVAEQGVAGKEAGDSRAQDAARATESVTKGLGQLNELKSVISATRAEQTSLLKIGQTTAESAEAAIVKSYATTNAEAAKIVPTLRAQIDEAERMGTMTPAAIAKARAAMADFTAETKYASDFTKALTKTLEDSLSNRGMQAIDSIAQALGNAVAGMESWRDVLSDIGKAFAGFAAGVLKDLASMIIKMYLFKLVQSTIGSMGGVSGLVAHEGGIVGAVGGSSRVVDLSMFRYAQRMHSGGGVGLASDEVPAILQKGEIIVSNAQQAAAKTNSGGGGGGNGGGGGIRNVLAVGDKEISSAMNGAHGERVIMNVLQRNAPTVKKYIG